jgi:uroporphyrinogen-III synthase
VTALDGLRIVLTRPRDQATHLARLIEEAGGTVILFPLLEIASVADPQPLDALVARLNEFDLAIFISPNAARYGMAAIRAQGALPPSLRIATIGQGSAGALRDLGVRNIIVPKDRFDSEALLALPELQKVHGWRVAIFRGEDGRELLGDTLKARGAQVEYVACYRRLKPQENMAGLADTGADALTVTSSEALACLWDGLDEHRRKQLAAVPLFVSHERIAAAARSLGWRQVVLAASGDDGLFAGLVAWATRRHG